MGTSYSYLCAACGHTVRAGKGRSVGMLAIVHAMRCRRCGYAGDVGVDGIPPWSEPDPEAERAALESCPECGGRDFEPWKPPYPCPKCATPMGPGNTVTMWD